MGGAGGAGLLAGLWYIGGRRAFLGDREVPRGAPAVDVEAITARLAHKLAFAATSFTFNDLPTGPNVTPKFERPGFSPPASGRIMFPFAAQVIALSFWATAAKTGGTATLKAIAVQPPAGTERTLQTLAWADGKVSDYTLADQRGVIQPGEWLRFEADLNNFLPASIDIEAIVWLAPALPGL